MKDLLTNNVLEGPFSSWEAVLSFLTGVKDGAAVRNVHITRQHADQWKVVVKSTKPGLRRIQSKPGAGLYDLSW